MEKIGKVGGDEPSTSALDKLIPHRLLHDEAVQKNNTFHAY